MKIQTNEVKKQPIIYYAYILINYKYMGGYGKGYIPFRINNKRCNQNQRKCPLMSVGYFYDAKHDSRSTQRMKYSDYTKRLIYGRVGLKLQRVSKQLNEFKRYTGGPGGGGMAPINRF